MFLYKSLWLTVFTFIAFIFWSCGARKEKVLYSSLTIIVPEAAKDQANFSNDILELNKPFWQDGNGKNTCEKYFFFPNESSLVRPNAKDTIESKLITTLPESKIASFFGVNEISLANRTEKHIHSLDVKGFSAQPIISDSTDHSLINALKDGRNIFVYAPEYPSSITSFSIGGAEYAVFRNIESLKKKIMDTLCTFKLSKGAKLDFDISILYKPKFKSPKTESACPVPSEVKVSNLSSKSVVITWKKVEDVSNYEFLFKPVNNAKWDSLKVNAPTVTLNNLQTATKYEFKLASLCGSFQNSKTVSNYTAIHNFNTIASHAPQPPLSSNPQRPNSPPAPINPPPNPINSPSDLENYFNTMASDETPIATVGELHTEMKKYFSSKNVIIYYEGSSFGLLDFTNKIKKTNEKFNLWKYIDNNHSSVEIHLK